MSERTELYHFLTEFSDVLQDEPGHTTLTTHNIEVGSARPVKLQLYRLPYAYRSTVQKELQDMLESGIIEPSSSDWAAPIVLVKKKDGSIRLCVDYRKLNNLSQSDAYPMPRIEDLIDKLGKAKYLTTLDLCKGYWQVPVTHQTRSKTAFTTPFGLFQFTRMPFGLKGAPATFQRMMDKALRGMDLFAGSYLDDIIIFSSSWSEHLEHLRTVFSRLRESRLTAKPSKCHFGMAQTTYLGHEIGTGKVCPEMSKVEAVRLFPTPRTKKQVRGFLGLTGYYRKFIPDYATIATPLTDLTRKTRSDKIDWTITCEESFQKLKEILCSTPVLQSPDFNKPITLQTDASNRGVAAVLSQTDDDGNDHPVAYFSRKLLPREEKYSTVEKECLAIKLGTTAFKAYLLGTHFTIQTDHRSLEWLDRLKGNNARLTRWSLYLQQFDFVVRYRPGKAHANADSLSRVE